MTEGRPACLCAGAGVATVEVCLRVEERVPP
jgi:hypothetical protein